MAYLLLFVVMVIPLIQAPLTSGGWIWDVGNAFGFISFAGVLYLFLDVGQGARRRFHQLTSYAVTSMVVLHIAWLWIPDETLWHYMLWDGPAYMLAGWIAFLWLLSTIVLALPATRRYWHRGYQAFTRWHYASSLLVVAVAWWHMTGSGFYISALEAALYGLLTIAVLLIHRRNKATNS